MKLVSIDIETTGLDPDTCQVIEIGAVIDDPLNPLKDPPKFHCYVTHKNYFGEPYALSMHPKIFRRLATEEGDYLYLDKWDVWDEFSDWLYNYEQVDEKWTVTGKNFAMFDDRFLRMLPNWNKGGLLRHRVLDPGSLWFRVSIDNCLPDMAECAHRASLPDTVSHTALEDAVQLMKIVQAFYAN